jgi:hypothetical protein
MSRRPRKLRSHRAPSFSCLPDAFGRPGKARRHRDVSNMAAPDVFPGQQMASWHRAPSFSCLPDAFGRPGKARRHRNASNKAAPDAFPGQQMASWHRAPSFSCLPDAFGRPGRRGGIGMYQIWPRPMSFRVSRWQVGIGRRHFLVCPMPFAAQGSCCGNKKRAAAFNAEKHYMQQPLYCVKFLIRRT